MEAHDLTETLETVADIKREIGKAVIGQGKVIEELLVACLCGGHVLLEGVPGLAKTLLVRCLAGASDLSYSRIQFTPDLMPADVTGVSVFDRQRMDFTFRKGPIFADIVLADEINRSPAKTQSALLEAMQERQVTVDGTTHTLSDLFTVVATQNPIEYEGTYPLPEAQLDRFLMKIIVDYPTEEEELAMLQIMNEIGERVHSPHALISKKIGETDLRKMRNMVHGVRTDRSIMQYIIEIVRQSRSLPSLTTGASPRAAIMMLQAAKALSLLRGNVFVRPDEVQEMAFPTLRHRLSLTPESQIEGLTADGCVSQLLKQVPVPR